MKMEVLSVKKHFQEQFGVLGSTKVKDWTSPLTPPPAPPPPAPPTQQQQHQEQQLQQRNSSGSSEHYNNNYNNNNNNNSSSKIVAAAAAVDSNFVDVVDGHPTTVLQMRQQQTLSRYSYQQQQQPPQLQQQHHQHQHHYQNQHHLLQPHQPSTAAAAAYQYIPQQQQQQPLLPPHHAYMTNVLSAPSSPLQSTAASRFGAADNLDDVNAAAVRELSQRLQAELRAAKSHHLSCTEVTLPNDLTSRIAAEIIRMSEREPCGERACTIFIEFESEPNNVRRIASFKVDPNTVSIFELYLTLKQDKSGWTSMLPQFLKNLTRSNTIMISPDFTLTKNKLYSSE